MNVRNLRECDCKKLEEFLARNIAPENPTVIMRQFIQRKYGDKQGYKRVIPKIN